MGTPCGIVEIEVQGVLHVVDLAVEILEWERKQVLAQDSTTHPRAITPS